MIQSLLTRIDSDRVNGNLAHAMAMADHKFTLENLHEDSNVHGMSWTLERDDDISESCTRKIT